MFLKYYAKQNNVSVYDLIPIMGVPKSTAYRARKRPELMPGYALANLGEHFHDENILKKFRKFLPVTIRYDKRKLKPKR